MSLPKAIICDIDGTLAHMVTRGPYDTSRYHEDDIDPIIREIVERYRQDGFFIIICSGRDDTYREVTAKWLAKHGVIYDGLLMRPADDKRNDAIIKREIYDGHIKDRYDIHFVLDDRDRVIAMWRDLGLKVLQVAPGDF